MIIKTGKQRVFYYVLFAHDHGPSHGVLTADAKTRDQAHWPNLFIMRTSLPILCWGLRSDMGLSHG